MKIGDKVIALREYSTVPEMDRPEECLKIFTINHYDDRGRLSLEGVPGYIFYADGFKVVNN